MGSPINDTAAPRRSSDVDQTPNRKLIRPSLAEVREQLARGGAAPAAASAPARVSKKPVPPDQTNAESFYFLKQMQTRTEMVMVLQDGERIRGVIEWYDRHCLKVHRQGEPNLLVYKSQIKYLFKAEDETSK